MGFFVVRFRANRRCTRGGLTVLLNAHEYGSELTSVIYAALLGETDWQVFVDRLNGLVPGGFSTLFFHDLRANEGAMAYVAGMQGREKALEGGDVTLLVP